MAKFTYVCRQCGSRDVRCDVWAVWSDLDQRWELGATFDQTFCETCEQEPAIVQVELGGDKTRKGPGKPTRIGGDDVGEVRVRDGS